MSALEGLGFLGAAVVALALGPLVMAQARRLRAFDYPGPGKLHDVPIPTLGGLAVVAGTLGTLWVLEAAGLGTTPPHALALSLAALPVLVVAVCDDLGLSSVGVKLLGHFLAGGILYAFGLRVVELTNPFGPTIELGPFAFVVTLLWVATIINAMNLVDGLDGLAAGVGAISAISLSVVGIVQQEHDVRRLGFVLAGALVGFLPYNFPRARVFLGDVGSTFVGLALATMALMENRKTTAATTMLLPLVALGLPLLDTLFAVARRTVRGRSPLRRDLDHLHHRLLRLGLSPRQAVASLLVVTILFGAVAVLLAGLSKQAALLSAAILGVAVFAGLAGLVRLERRAGKAARSLGGLPLRA